MSAEEQICNCWGKPRLRPRHQRNIPEKSAGARAPWVGAGPYLLSRVNTPRTLADDRGPANYAHCSLEDGNYFPGPASLCQRWKRRMKLGGATFLGRGPPPTHRLHSTLSLSGATKISRYLIRAKWDREEGGGGCGADLEPCVTVLPRVGAGASYTLPTNQIYLVFSVTREPSCDPSRHVGDLEHQVVSSGHLWSPAAGPGTRERRGKWGQN